MRLGLSAAVFYGRMETEEAAARLRWFDIDCCEIFLQTHSEYSAAFGRKVRDMLAGIPCVSVHPKGTQFESDLFGRSPRQRSDALQIFERVCEAGEAMGASCYVMHGPTSARHRITSSGIYLLKDIFSLMTEIAARHGLRILWENVSWCAMSTPEEVREISEQLPDAGFVLDTKQCFRAGVEVPDMMRAMGNRMRHIHVLDWNTAGELALPGEGVMDWNLFFHNLKANHYQGAVILEPYAYQGMDEQALARSLAYLRSAIGE